MRQLAAFLTAKVFAPEELCPSGVMYIVHRGTAFWAGKVVHAGGVWGDDGACRERPPRSYGPLRDVAHE